MCRRCISETYDPPRLLERFAYQTEVTFPNRWSPLRDVRVPDVMLGLNILTRVLWTVGYLSDYRQAFWQLAGPLMRAGRIEEVIHIGLVSHHLIQFTREALQGSEEACFYADPNRASPAGV